MKLPIGIDDFGKIINESYDLVDKSLLIKDIIEDGAEVILITRPRRFGKTINMSMLECFLGIHKKQENNLFKDLKISTDVDFCDTHQNKYPVIFITFKKVSAGNIDLAENLIKQLLSKLYRDHKKYLYEKLSSFEQKLYNRIIDSTLSAAELRSAIQELTGFYHKVTGIKPILLIDEYDSPIHSGYTNNYYEKIISLMQGIFGDALKGNRDLHKAVVTGITKVSAESLFSDLNNIKSYNVLDKGYSQYFGFSEEEVLVLINKSNLNIKSKDIKNWYNGYFFGDSIIYNPWSIINCLAQQGQLKSYWINTSQNTLLESLLSNSKANVKEQFETLLQDKEIEQPIEDNLVFPLLDKQDSALWTLLLYTGYLKAEGITLIRGQRIAKLQIPNDEVKMVYEKIFENWFYSTESLSVKNYNYFINSLKNNQLDIFEQVLKDYISESGSYFDFNKNTKEQVFHSFILGLVVGLREDYLIKSNQESGYGRFDVAFVPKDKTRNGIILEFKLASDIKDLENKANEALLQISDKRYTDIFKEQGIKTAITIGLAFCGKELKLLSKNINL
tara:strand:+ start:228 stop:1907 length:1680 start_codon:yes stop_codon:yes gene_type:complete